MHQWRVYSVLRLLTILLIAVMLTTVTPSQSASGSGSSNGSQVTTINGKIQKNFTGIDVYEPKVYDNRALYLMAEELNDKLHNNQLFFAPDKLAAALGTQQGSSSREITRSASFSTLPIPGLNSETETNSGLVGSDGSPRPDTTTQTQTTNRAAYTPTAPTLDTIPTLTGFNPTYSENASDLLSDQVNLTYQIFNLRMLLQQSLTDRVSTGTGPRRQAVLEFDVSIAPPQVAANAVAVIEITLHVGSGNGNGLSLVSLMPQEKTYNASAVSTKSNSFGGSAVAQIFQVGYSERRRGQIFYIYRDADTIAYQRTDNDDPDSVVFGWMFRPVLGRSSISPGMRQLFAVVALPSGDRLEGRQTMSFQKSDFKNIDNLIASLKNKSSESEFIVSQFSDRSKKLLSEAAGTGTADDRLQTVIVQEFNNLLNNPRLLAAEQLKNKITPDMRALSGNNPRGELLKRLNRLLLSKAFDGDLNPVDQSSVMELPTRITGSARTYWKKYDRSTMTAYGAEDTARGTRFRQAISLGLLKPEIFNSRYDFSRTFKTVEVQPTSYYQNNLAPTINDVSWVTTGQKSALISITGDNFFNNTQVAMGDKLYSGANDGMTIKSNQAIDITTSLDALSSGPGAILGRYGSGLPLVLNDDNTKTIFVDAGTTYSLALSGLRDLTVYISGRNAAGKTIPLSLNDLPGSGSLSPIVTINNKVLPPPYSIEEEDNRIKISTSFPDSFLSSGGATIKVTYPFRSKNWTASSRIADLASSFLTTAVDKNSVLITAGNYLGFRSMGSDYRCWKVLAGDETFVLMNSTRLVNGFDETGECKIEPGETGKQVKTLSNNLVQIRSTGPLPDKLVLISSLNVPYVLDLKKTTVPGDSNSASKPVELTRGDSVWVDINVGDDISKVDRVEANDIILRKRIKPSSGENPSKIIQFYVTDKVTARAGANVDVTLYDKDGKPIGKNVRLHINPCTNCK